MKQKKQKEKVRSMSCCSGVPSRGMLYAISVCPDQVQELVKDELMDCFLSADGENAMEMREACVTLMQYYGLPDEYEPMIKAMEDMKRETKKRK